ncbi:hypothetical protein [Neptuniibacter sp. QD57_21]|uniref:hypothetical protein n=1 Tax=Neptuniibacter sp. QD57_21 TaxID=3398213 RepID=UPI0039F47176
MHSIAAIIAKSETTKALDERFVLAKSIQLPQGFGMVPLTEALIEDITELGANSSVPHEEFEYLNISIVQVLEELSFSGLICYVETEYFGGDGGQSSIAWDKGKVIYGPTISLNGNLNPINDALKILGVQVLTLHDEFDEIGLGRNRSTDKWFEHGHS